MASFAGVVVVNKDKGYTSHDVVAILKRLYKEKAGHSGTLDPNATGVLPVCLGKATKFAELFLSDNKSYVAEVILGVTTDTGDVTGEILKGDGVFVHPDVSEKPKSSKAHGENPQVRELSQLQNLNFSAQDVRNALESFKGEYMQTPPMYSAIKIGGKKLYELARKGETVERKPRPVEIFDIKLLEFYKNGFTISVDCSKGTYIRALCADIGEKLGCGATMGDLRRTKSGNFCIEDSVTIEEIKNCGNAWDLATPIEKLLPYPAAVLKPAAYNSAKSGNPVKLANLSHIDTAAPKHWLQAEDKTIGLFTLKNNALICEVML